MVSAIEKLLAVEPDRLPDAVREQMLALPMWVLPIVPKGDHYALATPGAWDRPAPQALVPKLAIKTWRDAGTLGVVYEGVQMRPILDALLARPSRAQRIVAQAWTDSASPLKLYLTPYVDFSDISEARFLAGPHELRLVSRCLRGASTTRMGAAIPVMRALAHRLAGELPPRSHVLDFACLPDGSVKLVEVNPGLTPVDLQTLRQAARA